MQGDTGGRLGVIIGSGLDAGAVELTDGVVVIGRHRGAVPAHLVDHATNLGSLVDAGCDRVLALHSVGSLRLDWPVGTIVVPDDFFAPWVHPTTFGDAQGHRVPVLDPSWRQRVVRTWRSVTETPVHDGGIYAQTVGPRFETPAEIRFLATVADLVGMTLAAECTIACELDLAYASICVVDNLANGLGDTPLTVDAFHAGVDANRSMLVEVLPRLVGALHDGEPEASGAP